MVTAFGHDPLNFQRNAYVLLHVYILALFPFVFSQHFRRVGMLSNGSSFRIWMRLLNRGSIVGLQGSFVKRARLAACMQMNANGNTLAVERCVTSV
jgi:hypothetical protein